MAKKDGGIVDLYDAVKNLEKVELIEGPANLEVPSTALDYDMATLELNDFKDRVAFDATTFTEETKALEELSDILVRGQKYISLLYTYRSCSKALPMVALDTQDSDKPIIHRRTFDVLRPEILKLMELKDFADNAVNIVRQNLSNLVQPVKAKLVLSDSILDHLVRAINCLVLLDALKDMKACLLNDFSRYKRSFTPIHQTIENSDPIAEEIHNLQLFLGNPQQPHNLIMSNLKNEIQSKISGYDIIVLELLNHCADTIDDNRYLLPEESHISTALFRS